MLGNGGLRRLNNLPKVTDLVGDGVGTGVYLPWDTLMTTYVLMRVAKPVMFRERELSK